MSSLAARLRLKVRTLLSRAVHLEPKELRTTSLILLFARVVRCAGQEARQN